MNKAQNSAYCAYGYRCVGENRHSTQFSVPITQCDGYSACGWWCAEVYSGRTCKTDIVLSLVSPLPSVTSTVPVAGGVQWFTVAARAKQT